MTEIFTVTDLCTRIRDRLSGDMRLRNLWAKGELSNVTNHRSGHRYFTLKDKGAQISCVLFRSQALSLGFTLEDGQSVQVLGDVEVYSPQGRLQLIVQRIRRDPGFGQQARELEILKMRLSAEGLFSQERKRPLPAFPQRIGIVTSPDGAALRDVLRMIGCYPARILISPAKVQGEGAAQSVAQALRALSGRADLIIVCRGGGSAEDLVAFNEECVARAIFESDAPVISAIGHETDVTIADFVADIRAPTPTAAAEMAVPDMQSVLKRVLAAQRRLLRAVEGRLDHPSSRIESLQRHLSARRMYARTERDRLRLQDLNSRLSEAGRRLVRDKESRLAMAEGRLEGVSPLATLRRGYAIALCRGRVVSRAAEVEAKERIQLIMQDGKLTALVLDKETAREDER
ncbi:MAG: exodeoxyribonuclease VII large subunit [Methanosaeta sp. PtaU1.Bin028]|nr:MAG: exodeoxyribonuclease VII large subunit [Methanosaeta sp. PtaU1.Bin028]